MPKVSCLPLLHSSYLSIVAQQRLHETIGEQSSCQTLSTLFGSICYHFCFAKRRRSVSKDTPPLRAVHALWIACIFFVCAGLLVIPRLGIENDEALFAQGLYHPRAELYSLHIGRSQIPIMLMSYVGALKSWVYGPILRLFGISLTTLRLPMLLAGAASIWIFFLLMRRIAGSRAAAIAAIVLAADAQYLLTSCFDWGPVALQHLLLGAGALLLVRFYQEDREAALAAGCFLFGLALWDKALAVWMLSGLAVGGLATFPRQIAAVVTLRRLAIALLALILGVAPLLLFNATNHWATFHGNFERDTKDLPGKALFLVGTFGGSGLFGWMSAEDARTPQPHVPTSAIARSSATISALFGHPRQSLLLYALALAILLAPFTGWTNLRLILWCLIAMGIAWIQMAINRDTGGSIHHTILLWPLPQAMIALSFAGFARRFGRAAAAAVSGAAVLVAFSGALVVNEYYGAMLRNGGAPAWDDGVIALARYFKRAPAYSSAFAMDWGIIEPVRLLDRGRVRLASGTDQLSGPAISPPDQAILKSMVSDPRNLFIAHPPGAEFFQGKNAQLQAFAASIGFVPQILERFSDSFGRPFFEVYCFVPASIN
jgi:4-amino-4-deoxy-L-arabinose transferase-like glycosyltransferase